MIVKIPEGYKEIGASQKLVAGDVVYSRAKTWLGPLEEGSKYLYSCVMQCPGLLTAATLKFPGDDVYHALSELDYTEPPEQDKEPKE